MVNKDTTRNIGTELQCQTLVLTDGNGCKKYVAQIGYICYDRVGRANGFSAVATSDNFNTNAECQKWLKKRGAQ